MKKLFSLGLALFVTIGGYSQVQKVSRNTIKKNDVIMQKAPRLEAIIEYAESEPTMTSTRAFNSDELDYTYYDWQTNHGFINRTVVWPDGKVSFAFTYASNTNYSDRGTGIATYNSNTNQWTSLGGRIENEKTGFGSIARYGQNGLVVAAHTTSDLKVYRVNNKDNMTSNSAPAILSIGTDVYSHPCVTTSGSNHNIIHIVAAEFDDNDPDGDGIEHGIRYWRSSNGQTWDKVCVQLPYLSSNYGNKHGTNTYYWMETTDDNMIGLVINTGYTDGIVLYSTDNGNTWQRKIYFHDPCPGVSLDKSFFYPRWTSALWNDDMELMMAYEINGSSHSGTYNKVGGGCAFWSEYLPYRGTTVEWGFDPNNPMPPTPGQPFIMDSAYLYEDIYGAWCMWSEPTHDMLPEYFGYFFNVDEDGNWEDPFADQWETEFHFIEGGSLSPIGNHGSYNAGSAMQPVLCKVNGNDNELVTVWCFLDDENSLNDMFFFKLFAAYSCDGGLNWSHPVNLVAGEFEFTQNEMVYPQAAVIGNTLIVAAQVDSDPGTTVISSSEDGDPTDNAWLGFTYDINDLFSFYNPYTITATANPTNGGTVTGGGSYTSGSTCTLHAYANNGYSFVKWTKNGTQVSTNPNYSFTVTGNASYVAHFQQSTTNYTITATASPSNAGTITGAGTYASGSTCTLHANANSGYSFVEWTKNGTQVSTNPNYSFTVTGNASYVAHFQQSTTNYTITATASPSNAGTITGAGTYASGSTCTLRANANSGYVFVNWIENGTAVSTNATYSFSVTGNRNLVAVFDLAPTNYTISVTASPANGGSVTGGGTYTYGQSCTVSATAASGYSFVSWTENGSVVSNRASYTFTVTANRNLVANFAPNTYNINVSANPTNGGSVTGGGSFNYGQSCTVSATAASGYSFVNWTENGSVVSTSASYTFTVNSNRNLVANFTANPQPSYTIAVAAEPSNGGSVTGGGTYQEGQSCTVSATAASGYSFVNWTENGSVVSTNASYTFTVTSNRNLVANFTANPLPTYTIAVTAEPSNGGSVTGGGTYQEGQSCTVSATAVSGYSFINWTENGSFVSGSASYTFTVTSNRSLVANFTANPQPTYTIAVSAEPSNGGSVIGGGTYQEGQSCTVSATAASGYSFVNWTENGSAVSSSASYTFTVTSDRSLAANFSRIVNHYSVSVSVEPSGAGSIIGAGTYEEGATCTLIAMPENATYSFVSWTENGAVVSTDDHFSFTVDRDRNLVAVFHQGLFYTISASAGPNGSISPIGDVMVLPGEDKTFAMIPDNGCVVSKVLVDGMDVGAVESYTFRNVNGNHSIHVQFSGLGVDDHVSPSLKIYPNPAHDRINVESPNMKQIAVFNLLGVQIECKDVNGNHAVVNIADLPQGTYILRVRYSDENVEYSRFVVEK